jgi:hypothetical protein
MDGAEPAMFRLLLAEDSKACYHASDAMNRIAVDAVSATNFVQMDPLRDADLSDSPLQILWPELLMSFCAVRKCERKRTWTFLGCAHTASERDKEREWMERWRTSMIEGLEEITEKVPTRFLGLIKRTLTGVRDGTGVVYHPRPSEGKTRCPVCGSE